MALFRLKERDADGNKVGHHLVPPIVNGRFTKILPGSIIESSVDLVERFPNKFELVGGDSTPEPQPVESKGDPMEQRVKAARGVAQEFAQHGLKSKGRSRK